MRPCGVVSEAPLISFADFFAESLTGPIWSSSPCMTRVGMIVSGVICSNELQVWFVAQHVVEMPLVQAV